MSTRACPDWPDLMEVAPDLQFKHYTVGEAGLPVEVLTRLDYDSLSEIALCADLEAQRVQRDAHRAEGRRGARVAQAGARCTPPTANRLSCSEQLSLLATKSFSGSVLRT